jgi:hypothetical protein
VLLADDVIDFASEEGVFFVHEAVLTEEVGSPADEAAYLVADVGGAQRPQEAAR